MAGVRIMEFLHVEEMVSRKLGVMYVQADMRPDGDCSCPKRVSPDQCLLGKVDLASSIHGLIGQRGRARSRFESNELGKSMRLALRGLIRTMR